MRTALVTSGAITQRLDRLEEKGLITRGRSEADGRAVVVTLTDAGRAALDHFGPNVEWCAKKKKQIKDVQLELTGPGCRWSFELIAFRKGTSV